MDNLQNPSLSGEKRFLEFVKSYILQLQAENVGSIRVDAMDRHARSLLIGHVEDRRKQIDSLNPRDPYFGRIDLLNGLSCYITQPGKNIRVANSRNLPEEFIEAYANSDGNILIDAEAPLARSWYLSSMTDAQGLIRKRSYSIREGILKDIQEISFEDPKTEVDLSELEISRAVVAMEENRTQDMSSILSSMTQSQYEVVDLPWDAWTNLQGGPGTGKSAIALHRLSAIAYRLGTDSKTRTGTGLLFIGPTDNFLYYVQRLIPETLGKVDVEQKKFQDIFPFQGKKKEVNEDVATLKADSRMAEVVRHTVWDRMYPKAPIRYKFEIDEVSISVIDQFKICDDAKRNFDKYVSARKYLERTTKDLIRSKISESLMVRYGSGRLLDEKFKLLYEDIENSSEVRRQITKLAPNLNHIQLLERLKSDPTLFRQSWRAIFSDPNNTFPSDMPENEYENVFTLWAEAHEDFSEITESDIPLLAELQFHIEGVQREWKHIAVDESQDLTPMQLIVLGRLAAKGGLTLVGDLAQNTSPWYYESWESLWSYVTGSSERELVSKSLPVSYRVPSDILEYANKFRKFAGVETDEMQAARKISKGKFQIRVDSFSAAFVGERITFEANKHEKGMTVGVIGNFDFSIELAKYLDSSGLFSSVRVIDFSEIKGLEFDLAVVVSPFRYIEQEISNKHFGKAARKMWLLLTRGTKFLFEINLNDEPEAESLFKRARK